VNKTVAGLLSYRRAARQVSAAIQSATSLDHNGPLASRILHHIHENSQIRVGGLVARRLDIRVTPYRPDDDNIPTDGKKDHTRA